MKLLLDTCTFVWLISEYERIPSSTLEILRDRRHACLLSAVSMWELLVKHGKGKITIDSGDQTVFEFLKAQAQSLELEVLGIAMRDVAHVERLALLHQDPFDRLLICQAIENGLTLVTPDPAIRRYPIKTVWQ